jgi:hypothetical protein
MIGTIGTKRSKRQKNKKSVLALPAVGNDSGEVKAISRLPPLRRCSRCRRDDTPVMGKGETVSPFSSQIRTRIEEKRILPISWDQCHESQNSCVNLKVKSTESAN